MKQAASDIDRQVLDLQTKIQSDLQETLDGSVVSKTLFSMPKQIQTKAVKELLYQREATLSCLNNPTYAEITDCMLD